MPRYKDSPEVRAAKQERKDKLREFLSLLEVDDMHDLRSLFKEMVGEVLENGLEAEFDDELGYSKYGGVSGTSDCIRQSRYETYCLRNG